MMRPYQRRIISTLAVVVALWAIALAALAYSAVTSGEDLAERLTTSPPSSVESLGTFLEDAKKARDLAKHTERFSIATFVVAGASSILLALQCIAEWREK